MAFYWVVSKLGLRQNSDHEIQGWSKALDNARAAEVDISDYWRFDEFANFLKSTQSFDPAQKEILRRMLERIKNPKIPLELSGVSEFAPELEQKSLRLPELPLN